MLGSVPYGIETNGHEMVAERLPGSRLLQPAVVCAVFLFFFGNSVLLKPANELSRAESSNSSDSQKLSRIPLAVTAA